MNPDNQHPNAGLSRRLASLTYDVFLVVAVWFAVASIAVLLNNGEAIPAWLAQFVLLPALIGSTFYFYYWFWTHGGQSLGMRAWRLKMVSKDNTVPTPGQCAIRFSVAVLTLGAGLLFCLFYKNKDSLQCRLSDTQVILVPKEVY
jgi:uncharacterized RDD family membrane protein YckC